MPRNKILLPGTFHSFPLLAKEAQLQIWELAIAATSPRTVEIRDFTTDGRPNIFKWKPIQYISRTAIPALLHTCHASRNLSLKRWQLSFAADDEPAKVFFDFETDILWLVHSSHFGNHVHLVERTKVRYLALDFSDDSWIHQTVAVVFPSVKEFIFVRGPVRNAEVERRGGWVRFVDVEKREEGVSWFRIKHNQQTVSYLEDMGYKLTRSRYMDYVREYSEDLDTFKVESRLKALQIEG